MAKARAFIGDTADGDALVVTCTIGDVSDTMGKVWRAIKDAGLRPNESRAGWYKFNLSDDCTASEGKKVLRDALRAQGIDVS
jgi:hypothetical protein